jgi:hypothetical protein
VIHGDILGNVMLTDGHVPAVIDWPPYFRPAGMANAIAATDAVTFRAAPLSLLDEWSTGEDWNQLLVRALLYRLGPTGIFAIRNRLMGILVTHVNAWRPSLTPSSPARGVLDQALAYPRVPPPASRTQSSPLGAH